jgi:hypothetical protein
VLYLYSTARVFGSLRTLRCAARPYLQYATFINGTVECREEDLLTSNRPHSTPCWAAAMGPVGPCIFSARFAGEMVMLHYFQITVQNTVDCRTKTIPRLAGPQPCEPWYSGGSSPQPQLGAGLWWWGAGWPVPISPVTTHSIIYVCTNHVSIASLFSALAL